MINLKNYIAEGLISRKATGKGASAEDLTQLQEISIKEFICANYLIGLTMTPITIDEFDNYFYIEYDKQTFWVSIKFHVCLHQDAPSIVSGFKFKSLEQFSCKNNQNITSLDELPKDIKEINIKGCNNIKILDLPFKKLQFLNITKCNNLEQVNCPVKNSREISITQCPKLKSLNFPNLQKLKGGFYVNQNDRLESLEGAPREFCKHLSCIQCKNLRTLKGAPEKVGGVFNCSRCENLTSLEGAPKEVSEEFMCHHTSIVSLKGSPETLGGYFDCSCCQRLESLEGAPELVYTYFDCHSCEDLTSLKGAPKSVYGNFDCSGTSITSLEGAPVYIAREFRCIDCDALTNIACDIDYIGNRFHGTIDGKKTVMSGREFVELVKGLKK